MAPIPHPVDGLGIVYLLRRRYLNGGTECVRTKLPFCLCNVCGKKGCLHRSYTQGFALLRGHSGRGLKANPFQAQILPLGFERDFPGSEGTTPIVIGLEISGICLISMN